MNNEDDDVDLLRDALLRHDAEPTDGIVDAFLAGIGVDDHDKGERVRRLFVSRLLADVHPRPVKEVERPWSFGRWMEAIRTSLGLTRHDIALAVGSDPTVIEQVEGATVPPWAVQVDTMANLVCLFRLHIVAVEQLFMKSQAVWNGQSTVRVAARSSTKDAPARGESAKRALDLYLAANSRAHDTGVLRDAIKSLRAELERRGAVELLRASR